MSISWLKASSDRKSFKIFESFGMDVYKINDLEKTDEKIKLYLIFMAWHVNILNTDDTWWSKEVDTNAEY